MQNKGSELAQLIAEQKRDDRDFQAPERNTVPYGLVLDVRDQDGRMVAHIPRGNEPECAIHGKEDLAVDETRGYRCRVCDRERKRAAYQKAKREREKEAAYKASHRASAARSDARKAGRLF